MNGLNAQGLIQSGTQKQAFVGFFLYSIVAPFDGTMVIFIWLIVGGLDDIVMVGGGVDWVVRGAYGSSRVAQRLAVFNPPDHLSDVCWAMPKVAKRRTQINMSFLHDNTSACSS